MKTLRIARSDLQGPFIVPPELAADAITQSYACTEDLILCRVVDRIARTERIEAYRWPDSDSRFEPQNEEPEVGAFVGNVELVP